MNISTVPAYKQNFGLAFGFGFGFRFFISLWEILFMRTLKSFDRSSCLEAFCKKQFWRFREIPRKADVMEPSSKVAGCWPATFFEKDSSTDVFIWFLWNVSQIYSAEYLSTTNPESCQCFIELTSCKINFLKITGWGIQDKAYVKFIVLTFSSV